MDHLDIQCSELRILGLIACPRLISCHGQVTAGIQREGFMNCGDPVRGIYELGDPVRGIYELRGSSARDL